MKIYNIKPEDYKIKIVMRGENIKLPTSIENILNENIDTKQDKILEFCKEPKTTKEIMAYLGLKDRRKFYLKYMRPLLDSGKLKMTIPDKPNTKNQKYVAKQGK